MFLDLIVFSFPPEDSFLRYRKICLLLQKQKELLESDKPLEEMARTFIVYDNEFHYSLYELAGRKNISLFYAAVNSQYERFRTFINLEGKHELERLYNIDENVMRSFIIKLDEEEVAKVIRRAADKAAVMAINKEAVDWQKLLLKKLLPLTLSNFLFIVGVNYG